MTKAQSDLYRGRGKCRVGAERLERYAIGRLDLYAEIADHYVRAIKRLDTTASHSRSPASAVHINPPLVS